MILLVLVYVCVSHLFMTLFYHDNQTVLPREVREDNDTSTQTTNVLYVKSLWRGGGSIRGNNTTTPAKTYNPQPHT